MSFGSLWTFPATALGCFIVVGLVSMYIAKKCGPAGLRAFADVIRAFWGRKR